MRPNDASKSGRTMVQITRDSGERSERTHGAESRLGVPRKQNGGERRARLGGFCRQARPVRERKRGRKGTTTSHQKKAGDNRTSRQGDDIQGEPQDV